MLTSIRIQNFRSIRDASVKLGQVNLFIGPNNSGKSNFLKGISLFSNIINNYPEAPNNYRHFPHMINRKYSNENSINFSFKLSHIDSSEHFILYPNSRLEIVGEDFKSIIKDNSIAPIARTEKASILVQLFHKELGDIRRDVPDTKIYKPDPALFGQASTIKPEHKFNEDGSNIISYIFNLNQDFRASYDKLEYDLKSCVPDISSVSTPVIKSTKKESDSVIEETRFALRFFDNNGSTIWASEASEGVLYFLALLCIIHQPDPPKLLLLEEPEKGIHPRRIREVMDFIFELARLRDIQIILTSHSPYVVDHFADIPECISVFDRENGETVIRNAADIIEETNARLKEPIRYSDALGEHWVSGFLGGVPL